MPDDITTRPMLDGQRQLGSQMAEIRATLGTISQTQTEIAAKQQELAAKQDQLDARVTALTREVRNGFDDYNRKINALNQRLLSFETWLSRIDDRLHDEIIARTR
jgi:outer membrane murein-binding lipoprotein Lpp